MLQKTEPESNTMLPITNSNTQENIRSQQYKEQTSSTKNELVVQKADPKTNQAQQTGRAVAAMSSAVSMREMPAKNASSSRCCSYKYNW